MDKERFQQMEKRLNEQLEATGAMNKTLHKFLAVMANQEAARNVAPPPLASPPPVTTPLKASHPSRVNPGTPSNFDGDRARGCTFLTSCELYILLSQLNFIEDQVCIHWALSYFNGGCVATFAERVIRQEMQSGKMCFASWDKFRDEFTAVFCPENEATTALMRLELDQYFQGKWNIEVYIDEFKDLVNLSEYTDPITIVLKFHCGLNPTTQDRIVESGTDRPQDRDFDGWFKVACRLDLNCLANKAFHYASRCPLTQSAPTLTIHSAPPCNLFSFFRSQAPPIAVTPVAMHTPSRALHPGVPMDVDHTWTFKPIAQTCYRCGQTGHISKECDLHHDVVNPQHFVHASSTVSGRLAEAFTKNLKLKDFHDIVPTSLHTYVDVFSETAFDSLPECRKWDHTIELEREPSP
jgi:hypothetical protein